MVDASNAITAILSMDHPPFPTVFIAQEWAELCIKNGTGKKIMRFFKAILPTIVAMLVAGGVSWATMYRWSQTANTNATADATINWAEGMAPSQVNDSARAMMAAVSKYRDDVSGNLVTAGTSTAYTLTSNQVFATLAVMDGMELCFRMSATNGTSPTLNVDGLGAKAINSVSGTAIPSGSLISGAVYCAVYNNANNQFLMKGGVGAGLSAPSGTTMIATTTSCPTGWTKGSTHNDKALRLVTGTPSTGGTNAFSTTFGQTVTGGTSITQANLPSYNLTSPSMSVSTSLSMGVANLAVTGGSTPVVMDLGSASGTSTNTGSLTSGTVTGTIPSGGSGTAHTHSMDTRVQYVDVVLCTKD